MKRNILILGVAAVQYDAICYLKEQGYKVHAIARGKDGPGADAADVFAEIDILNLQQVESYIIENNIEVVYSVGSDLAMPVVSALSERLALPHFVSESAARICNNKDKMRKTLGSGFPGNISFKVLEKLEQPDNLNYPFIVKPTDSQGQRGVSLVHNAGDFEEAYHEAKKSSRSGLVIAEQYVGGSEVSVNGYMINGELKFLAVSDRETWPQFTGLIHKHILPSVLVDDLVNQKVRYCLEKISQKIGIANGPVYAQMKIESNEPYLIEITPRLDGCHMWNVIHKNAGMNLMALTFDHLLNNDTNEIEKYIESNDTHVLEFICQKPNEKADYSSYKEKMDKAMESYQYYDEADQIRPINGKHEKIGYFIYETD